MAILEQEVSSADFSQKSLWRRLNDFVFGYDYFISYAWADGRTYAIKLAENLEERGLECFLDSDDFAKGDNWKSVGQRALAKTSRLVLIGSPKALESKPALREVAIYTGRNRHVIPISFDGSLDPGQSSAPVLELITSEILRIEEKLEQLALGPSDEVTDDLSKSFKLLTQEQKRRRLFLGIASAFVVVAAVAIVLGVVANRERETSQSRERATINAQLELDENSSPSALDLSRRTSLDQLLARARSSAHNKAIANIEQRLQKIPPETSRVTVLVPNTSRLGFVTAGVGNRLFVWTADRIEAYEPGGQAPTAVYRQQGGRILWAQGDPCADGVLFETDFESFADPAVAACVQSRQGRRFKKHVSEHAFDGEKEFDSEVVGNERGIFFSRLTEPDGGTPESLGLSHAISTLGLAGDRDGSIVDYVFLARRDVAAPSRDDLLERRYAQTELSIQLLKSQGYGLNAGDLSVLPDKLNVSPLTYAASGQAAIYDAAYTGVKRTYFMDGELGPMDYEFILPCVREGGDRIIKLAEPIVYCEQAKIYDQADAFKKLNLTDIRPNYRPAALDMSHRQAVVRDRLFRFPEGTNDVSTRTIDLDWDTVTNVRFTSNGEALILGYKDRGIGLYDLRSSRLVHRFPGPNPQVRDVAASNDGQFVYVLESTGALTRWKLAEFGPDGWSAAVPRH